MENRPVLPTGTKNLNAGPNTGTIARLPKKQSRPGAEKTSQRPDRRDRTPTNTIPVRRGTLSVEKETKTPLPLLQTLHQNDFGKKKKLDQFGILKPFGGGNRTQRGW